MAAYKTDEEQVEILKAWWKKYGSSVTVGAILGITLVFGWQAWQAYQVSQGEKASTQYSELTKAINTVNIEQIEKQAQQLSDQQSRSVYSLLAALQQAKLAYSKGDKAASREYLQRAMQNIDDTALKALVRLRLVDLLIDMQKLEAALQEINNASNPTYTAEFIVRRADIAYKQGDHASARSDYQEALNMGVANSQFVQMKLEALGDS